MAWGGWLQATDLSPKGLLWSSLLCGLHGLVWLSCDCKCSLDTHGTWRQCQADAWSKYFNPQSWVEVPFGLNKRKMIWNVIWRYKSIQKLRWVFLRKRGAFELHAVTVHGQDWMWARLIRFICVNCRSSAENMLPPGCRVLNSGRGWKHFSWF